MTTGMTGAATAAPDPALLEARRALVGRVAVLQDRVRVLRDGSDPPAREEALRDLEETLTELRATNLALMGAGPRPMAPPRRIPAVPASRLPEALSHLLAVYGVLKDVLADEEIVPEPAEQAKIDAARQWLRRHGLIG